MPSPVALVHIAAGTIVLAVVPAALLARKGGVWHRRWGATFMWAMAGVTLTASMMWQAKGHLFLLFLDIISVFLVVSGYRILSRRRRASPNPRADAFDLAAAAAAVAAGLALIFLGKTAATPLMHSIAEILIVLGTIGATFGFLEAFALRIGPRTRFGWMFYHLSAMLAAYISAVTAFIVINAHGVPMLYRWLVPGLGGTFLITAISMKYRLRFFRADRAAARRRATASGGEVQASRTFREIVSAATPAATRQSPAPANIASRNPLA